MEFKKGIQLSQAFGAVLAVVLVAVLVIIAIFLFQTLGTGFATTAFTIANETDIDITTKGTQLAPNACSASAFSIFEALNNSDNLNPIIAANYTVSNTGIVTNLTVLEYNNATLSYTYVGGESACNATDTMITQFATYPALVGLVGTIVFLGLVIGVLVGSFVFGGRRRV